MGDIIDRLLKRLGLIRINRAKYLNGEIVGLYQNQVKEWLKDDAPHLFHSWNDNALSETKQWACNAFDECMSKNADEGTGLILKGGIKSDV